MRASGGRTALSLGIGAAGVATAVAVMLLSLSVVTGFKGEITRKVLGLDSHIKIANSTVTTGDASKTAIDGASVARAIASSPYSAEIASVSLIGEKPCVLKTRDDFKGVVYRGVDGGYDWGFFTECLVAGRLPDMSAEANAYEIMLSSAVSREIGVSAGDSVYAYFIDERVRARRCPVVGVFSTDFEEYDGLYVVGNIRALQNVNGWGDSICSYVGVNVTDPSPERLEDLSYSLYGLVVTDAARAGSHVMPYVTDTRHNNVSYFSWLGLLDMNAAVIIVLMMIVSAFTLIACMLMIALERVAMIGTLKTLGATSGALRQILMLLTSKLTLRGLVYGNLVAIAIALLQRRFHIIGLNADMYYMPWVPMELNALHIVLLDLGVLVVSYAALIGPSMLVASLRPSASIRYE